MHHNFAADKNKKWNRNNCRRDNPIPSPSHKSSINTVDPARASDKQGTLPTSQCGVIPNARVFISARRDLASTSTRSSRKLVVHALQSLAQMQHRVSLAREKRIHAHACLFRHLLETPPLQLVSDKYFSLLLRQLTQCALQFLQQHIARENSIRPIVERRQQIFEG